MRRILNLGLCATLAFSFTAPLLFQKPYKCFWSSSKQPQQDLDQLRNRLKNRLSIVEYPSNTPNEDTSEFLQLTSVEGYAVAIFDGHDGNEMSEYLKERLLKNIDQKIKANLEEEIKGDRDEAIKKAVTSSILQAFIETEKHILQQVQNSQGVFNKKQGSCAVVALVIDDYLYVANLGDSEAMIVSYEEGKVGATSITKKMNINNPYVFHKLRSRYDEKSTFVDLQGRKYISTPECNIQVTGSFGDWLVKRHVAKFSKAYQEALKYKKNKDDKRSNIPLVTAKPKVAITQLKQSDAYLLLGSNGFWDEIKSDQIAETFKSEKEISEHAAEKMLENVISNIAQSMNKPQQFIRDLPSELRPRVFDDVTIVLVDLKNQLQQSIQ